MNQLESKYTQVKVSDLREKNEAVVMYMQAYTVMKNEGAEAAATVLLTKVVQAVDEYNETIAEWGRQQRNRINGQLEELRAEESSDAEEKQS